MPGETNLDTLLKTMMPLLNDGDYVFCTTDNLGAIPQNDIISFFKEAEGFTIVIEKSVADTYGLAYTYVAAWITLTVHSSLDAVGLTAAFSNALDKEGISCNVIAAYYHDHIFIARQDAERAMAVLEKLSGK